MGDPRLNIHCLVVSPRQSDSAQAHGLVADAHALGIHNLAQLVKHELYFLQGELSHDDLQRLATELLTDPVVQTYAWRNGTSPLERQASEQVIEVALRPGVTDTVAPQIVHGAHALGIRGVQHAATGQRYTLRGRDGPLAPDDLHRLARYLLANTVIQRYALGTIEPIFPQPARASGVVAHIPLTELDSAELLALSAERRAALDLNEMTAIQSYFRREGREPTDVEFEMLAQTWSEHCVHKTFKAKIEIGDWRSGIKDWRLEMRDSAANPQSLTSNLQIEGLLKTFIRAATERIKAPWVRAAFVDNAGIIDFDDTYEVSFKVETHNHPSAIEPFGGAHTGVGGVIRDILGVSAKPIAVTDVLCFGPTDLAPAQLPEGVLHPRRIASGVVAGIQDYGNKLGIPTVSGAIYYDAGYISNPLVFCGCVGIAPKGEHPRAAEPGDRVIVLGGRTGRDGLRGATFSSMTMDAQTGEVAGASVQIGDPLTEKGLIEVITRARAQRLYHAITDCGAGGLSSAVGELAAQPPIEHSSMRPLAGEMAAQAGVEVELQDVRLKYPDLAPWEIWLSEAQERMVLAVPPANLGALQALCDTYEVELTDIGAFTDSGRVVVRYAGRTVLDLENAFLHEGIPQRRLRANGRRTANETQPSTFNLQPPTFNLQPSTSINWNQTLLSLLASPNIASKAAVIRRYDHEVQGGTVVKPLTGVRNDGPSDGVVIKPLGTRGARGIVLSCGLNPEYGKRDAYRMALSVIDEAIRNAVAAGADPERIALLDNFCWGDPKNPETLGTLVEAARGCYDGARLFGTPFISGKDSLNNEYLGADGKRHAIPPTLLISAIGIIEDVAQAVTTDFQAPGNAVYRVGVWARDALPVPPLAPETPAVYRALHQAMRAGWVRACHDLSEGGLAVAAAEMCIGGRFGATLAIERPEMLVGETNGCLLVEVQPGDCAAFESLFQAMPHALARLGETTRHPRLEIAFSSHSLASLSVEQLVHAWQSPGGVFSRTNL